jgi:hypothetical protein
VPFSDSTTRALSATMIQISRTSCSLASPCMRSEANAFVRVTAAVNRARRRVVRAVARHASLPSVRAADKVLAGVNCILLDAAVITAHYRTREVMATTRLLAVCDAPSDGLAWRLRPGSAGSNTAAGHVDLLGEAMEALPPQLRRRLMVTCDGAGASRDLVKELDWLASRHGYQLTYSAGWGALRAGEGPRSARSRGRVDDRHRSPEGFFGRYTPETGWVLAKP